MTAPEGAGWRAAPRHHAVFSLLLLLNFPSLLQADLLLGIPWTSPRQLRAIAAVAPQVRYAAPGLVFAAADAEGLRQLRAQGFHPFLIDRPGPGDRYYLTEHLERPLREGAVLLHEAGPEWALLRLPRDGFAAALESHDFLWPLPESYSLRGWLEAVPRRKPTIRAAGGTVAELMARVEVANIERHVQVLALIDPEGQSTAGNLSTRYAFRSETLEAAAYIRDRMAEYLGTGGVETEEFSIPELPHPGVAMHNVVGTLPGTDPEAGYYVVCAHYDAIASRTPGSWDWRSDPAPGADDNASGVALLLESARVLAGRSFPWSVRFIAFSGEEIGLWGSRAHARQAAAREDRLIGVLNFDMIGYNHLRQRLELVTNPASRWMVQWLAEANERYGIGLKLDVLEDSAARLSDHAPFWARGYDAILAIENYLPTDPDTPGVRNGDYRINTQYHTLADVPDSINYELVRRATQLVVASLGQYGAEEGEPNLAVFSGDLRADSRDNLRLRIANIGLGRLDGPYRVRVSRCAADSSDCRPIYDGVGGGPLEAGAVVDVVIPWNRFGEMVFLSEVDPEDAIGESNEGDNRALQLLHLVPQSAIRVYPNPFRPGEDGFLSFGALPPGSRLSILTLGGEPVWEARADRGREPVRWHGQNASGFTVGSGVYLYLVSGPGEEKVAMGKIVLMR